jgi:hypothetical protein
MKSNSYKYYLSPDGQSCTQPVPNCEIYNDDGTCRTCERYYYAKDGVCIKGSDACISYDSSEPGKCNYCNEFDGGEWIDEECVVNPDHPLKNCAGTGMGICYECNPGYTLDENKMCTKHGGTYPPVPNCAVHDQYKTYLCIACEKGYRIFKSMDDTGRSVNNCIVDIYDPPVESTADLRKLEGNITAPVLKPYKASVGIDYSEDLNSNVLFISADLEASDTIENTNGTKKAKIKPILKSDIIQQLDIKIDDGKPNDGSVRSVGDNCMNGDEYRRDGICGVVIELVF